MEPTLPQTAATALINVSLAWMTGVLASRFWLMKGSAAWREPVVRRLDLAMPAGLVACAVGLLLSLWAQAAAMGDVAWRDAWPACAEMLAVTHYGHAGVAALALLIAAMFFHWRFRRKGAEMRYVASLAVLVLLVAATRVAIGHAFEHGPLSVAALAEWVHILLMALWAGEVFVAAWLVLPRVLVEEAFPTRERAAYLGAMSHWATAALAGILATGAYNTYRVLGGPRDLIDGDYGHVLVFKLCFVLLAIVLGGVNRFYGLPAALSSNGRMGKQGMMKSQRGLRTVIVVLRVESAALLLVLVAAAVLAGNAPPGQGTMKQATESYQSHHPL